ncbi:hypothetical protein Lser_V15G03080 [Lactuca serriola]
MAHNRQSDLKPNHPSSSDDEEEEEEEEEVSGSEDEQTSDSGSEEASDSDSEPKQKQEPKKPLIPPRQPATKPQPPDLSSSETEESGSDTDSDSQPKKSMVADPNIKPISSKPMEREDVANVESKSAKKSGSKASSVPSPAKAKRPAPPPVVEKDTKKAKKSTTTTDDDSKKQLFQRLWSEDDEIVILKGMIDYKTEKNGENPVADMGAFHEFIKKSLHVDVSRAQLVDKVRRLKKKYVNNASREKDGKDRSFSKSHEQKGYELSKLIWGSSNSPNTGTESKKTQPQKNGGAKGNANANPSTSSVVALEKTNGVDEKEGLTMEAEKNMDVSRFVQYGRMSYSPVMEEEIMKAGLELVEGSKKEELKEKWNKLKMQELQLYVQRMDLIKEQAAVVFEAMNSAGN